MRAGAAFPSGGIDRAWFLLFTLLLLTPTRPALAQAVPPNEDWRQLTTEHFVITEAAR